MKIIVIEDFIISETINSTLCENNSIKFQYNPIKNKELINYLSNGQFHDGIVLDFGDDHPLLKYMVDSYEAKVLSCDIEIFCKSIDYVKNEEENIRQWNCEKTG